MSDKRFGVHRISVRSMVTELQAKRCFVNKQLTYDKNFICAPYGLHAQNGQGLLSIFLQLYEKILNTFGDNRIYSLLVHN